MLNKKHLLIFVVVVVVCIVVFMMVGLFLYFHLINKQDCFIHINKDTTQQHPLILNTRTNQFYLPNQIDGINIKSGEKLLLSCPGKTNYLKLTNVTEIDAVCVKNKTFQINNIEYDFKKLQCHHHPEITAVYSENNCSKIYREINVGFTTKRGFLLLYTSCFNVNKSDTLYSMFNLTTKIKAYQYTKRPRFKSLHFYTIDPSVAYTKKYQLRHFTELLGTSKYISLKSEFFLARGHLTAKADFIYASQQRATFLYINVAPQWQTFNGKNWMKLENCLRDFVAKNNDVAVYTGVFGNAKLPNINGTKMDLTLYNINETNALSVPNIFWKIVHDPVTNKGIVFVGHNNPYELNVNYYCTDVCDQINWVVWNRKNITDGFSYCCDYHEFKSIVDYAPELPINEILK